jgi:S1-C subfamily serine protease
LADYFGVKDGVLVRSVLKDSPAEKAGLKAGDIIVRVGETKVTTPRDVSSAIRTARSQKTFPITVVRNRKEMTLTVTLENSRSGQDYHREFRVIRNTELNESRL